jgi:hypothetical protein
MHGPPPRPVMEEAKADQGHHPLPTVGHHRSPALKPLLCSPFLSTPHTSSLKSKTHFVVYYEEGSRDMVLEFEIHSLVYYSFCSTIRRFYFLIYYFYYVFRYSISLCIAKVMYLQN